MLIEKPRRQEIVNPRETFLKLAVGVSAFRRIAVWQIPYLIQGLGLNNKELAHFVGLIDDSDLQYLPNLLLRELRKTGIVRSLTAEGTLEEIADFITEWEVIRTRGEDGKYVLTAGNIFGGLSQEDIKRLTERAHYVGFETEKKAIETILSQRTGSRSPDEVARGDEFSDSELDQEIVPHLLEAVFHLESNVIQPPKTDLQREYESWLQERKTRNKILEELLDPVLPVRGIATRTRYKLGVKIEKSTLGKIIGLKPDPYIKRLRRRMELIEEALRKDDELKKIGPNAVKIIEERLENLRKQLEIERTKTTS